MATQSCSGELKRGRTTHLSVRYVCTGCNNGNQARISKDTNLTWGERTAAADFEARSLFVHNDGENPCSFIDSAAGLEW